MGWTHFSVEIVLEIEIEIVGEIKIEIEIVVGYE